MPIISVLDRESQEAQKLRVSPRYIVSLRSVWAAYLMECSNLGSLYISCMAVSLYIGSNQLLGKVSLMTIELGLNL